MPYKTTLTYGTNSYETLGNDAFAQYIKGVSSRDGKYSAFLSNPYEKGLKIKEAHLVSNGNKEVDEYFKVEITTNGNNIKGFTATSVSDATNPTAAVASTLKVTVYDMYGHEYVIEFSHGQPRPFLQGKLHVLQGQTHFCYRIMWKYLMFKVFHFLLQQIRFIVLFLAFDLYGNRLIFFQA